MGRSLTVGFVALAVASLGAAATTVAEAAKNRNIADLRALVSRKADVKQTLPDGSTALHWAAAWGSVEAADLLIRAGADPKAATPFGATPLYLACERGDAAMITRLLAAGADPNATFLTHGETPLMFASRSGSVDAVRVLLDAGAKTEAQESIRGTTAVIWASEQNHPDVVKLLLARGADVKAHSKIEIPVARGGRGGGRAAAPAKPPAGTKPVAEAKPGPNAEAGGAPPAAAAGVMEEPPPPAIVAKGGMTALISAAREGSLELTKVLLDGGAPINQASGDGSTPLLVAMQNGQSEVVHLLIERGADVNLANSRGWAPLYIAVKNRTYETGGMPFPRPDGMLDVIKQLLEKGANVNARLKADTEVRNDFRAVWLPETGATPFVRAAFAGDLEVMQVLLAHGADPKITVEDGTNALMALAGVGYAEGFVHDFGGLEQSLEAMKLLLKLGFDVNAKNQGGMTAIHGAANKNFVSAIQLLADNGADLRAESKGNLKSNFRGISLLDWAEGVQVAIGPSAIYHTEAVELIEKLMKERNIPLPALTQRTKGGKVNQKAE